MRWRLIKQGFLGQGMVPIGSALANRNGFKDLFARIRTGDPCHDLEKAPDARPGQTPF